MYESPSWLHELWIARDTLWAGFQASVYVSALADFFGAAYKVGDRDGRLVELLLFAGAVYFVLCFTLSQVVRRLQKRMATV